VTIDPRWLAAHIAAKAVPILGSVTCNRRMIPMRWGFTWGGHWLVPDGMHFEYLGPPPQALIEPQRVVCGPPRLVRGW
jgi:hypothetical protein